MNTAHTPYLTEEQVFALNEKHGWFQSGDAQSDVSKAFAQDAIATYERVRDAAPELFAACQAFVIYDNDDAEDGIAMMLNYDKARTAIRAVITKVTGISA